MSLHIDHGTLHVHPKLLIFVKVAKIVNFELSKYFLNLNLLLLAYFFDYRMNSFKELVHFFIDSGAIIADSALLNFGELMLEVGEIFFKILHDFNHNRSQVQ